MPPEPAAVGGGASGHVKFHFKAGCSCVTPDCEGHGIRAVTIGAADAGGHRTLLFEESEADRARAKREKEAVAAAAAAAAAAAKARAAAALKVN